jgi:hypothetical protein
MTKPPPHNHDAEFGPEIARLRSSLPTLTELELDRVKARVRGRGHAAVSWRPWASTRAAMVAVIATGAVMSTGGAAIGVTGWAASGGASVAQYSAPGSNGSGASGVAPSGAVLPTTGKSTTSPSTAGPKQAVSAEEQVAQPEVASSGTLPFTGFLVIPLLIIGVALMVVGVITRRAVGRSESPPAG